MAHAPIVYLQVSGIRPFVRVKLNGKPFLFMVHSYAGFNAMTTYAIAADAGVRNLVAKDHFGIHADGKVSPLGRSLAVADSFAVAGVTIRNMPIQVFEIPQEAPTDGMAGAGWLRQAMVLVDFGRDLLSIPRSKVDGDRARQRLVGGGYVGVPMTWDPKHVRYFIEATIEGNSGRFGVSTVSHLVLDERFSRAIGARLSAPVEDYHGPTGTHGSIYNALGHHDMQIGGKPVVAPDADVYDLYDYDGTMRPSDRREQSSGILGGGFMRANKVVVDFGSGMMFIKARTTGDK